MSYIATHTYALIVRCSRCPREHCFESSHGANGLTTSPAALAKVLPRFPVVAGLAEIPNETGQKTRSTEEDYYYLIIIKATALRCSYHITIRSCKLGIGLKGKRFRKPIHIRRKLWVHYDLNKCPVAYELDDKETKLLQQYFHNVVLTSTETAALANRSQARGFLFARQPPPADVATFCDRCRCYCSVVPRRNERIVFHRYRWWPKVLLGAQGAAKG